MAKDWWMDLEKELRALDANPEAAGGKMAIALFEKGDLQACHQRGLMLLNAARDMCLRRRVCSVTEVCSRDERGLIERTSKRQEVWPDDLSMFHACAAFYSNLSAIAFNLRGQVQLLDRKEPSNGLSGALKSREQAYYPRSEM
jgi:hypothetical protein